MNPKITLRNSKQNSFINSFQSHRHTLSQGQEFKFESPSNQETSAFTSFQSLKSSSLHLKKLVKSPLSQLQMKSARQYDLNENFLSQRQSVVQMMQAFSNNYEIIQHSEPLEYIEMQKLFPVEEQKQVQNNEVVQDGTLNLIELKQDSYNWISINRFRFHYFTIKIQGQDSPIQVYVKCDKLRLMNYRMYISTTAQFPTKFNCEAVVQSKYFKYSDRKHNDKFQDKQLFISIYSEEDCEIQISFIYGNKFIKKQQPKREKPNYDKYRHWLSQSKYDISIETDKIYSNLDTRQYSREARKEKLIQSQDQLDQRMRTAMIKKKEIQEEKKYDLLSKYQANETLKEIRNMQKLKQRFIYALKKFQIQWLSVFILLHFAENIKILLDGAKKRSKYLAKGRLIVWKYKTTTMIKIKESGSTVEQRNMVKLCMSICMYATHNRKIIQLKTGKVLQYFLSVTHQYCHFIQKHKDYTQKVNYVKRVFRNLKQKEKAYKDRLWRLLNKYAQEVLHNLGANFTNSKKRTYIIDNTALLKAMEDFLSVKKIKCQQYVQQYVREKDKKQKVVDYAINMMQPEMFDTPSYDDLYGIFRTYIQCKKLATQQTQQQIQQK